MSKAKSYIPDGKQAVTPHLIVNGAAKAIEFYKKAFGAEELVRIPTPDGKLLHGCISIDGSHIMLADEMNNCEGGGKSPQSLGSFHTVLHIYVENVDEAFKRAVDAGATAKMPPMDMFWGDRYGQLVDPFGHVWSLATKIEELTPAQMQERAKECMQKMDGAAAAAK